MGLLTFIAELRATQLVDDMAKQVTRQVASLVRNACARRVATMSHAEARGYLWAKARPMISAEVRAIAVAQPALRPLTLAALSERAHDRIVHTVLAELMQERTRYVGQRRAA